MIVRGKFVSLPNKKIMLCRKDIKYNCLKINRCVPYGMMSYRNGSSPLLIIEKSKQECRNYGFKYTDY